MSELEAVKAENERLKAELAAIRDARNQEIDDIIIIIRSINRLRSITKDQGRKIEELRGEIEAYEAMKEGFAIRLADVEKERDEARRGLLSTKEAESLHKHSRAHHRPECECEYCRP